MKKNGCALCKAYTQKFRLVFTSEYSFSVVCQKPLKYGHLMILPKRHVTKLSELNPKEAQDLLNLIAKANDFLKTKVTEDMIIHMNTGNHGSQDHIHFHILPSKGNLRQHMAKHEKISKGINRSDKYLGDMKKNLLK